MAQRQHSLPVRVLFGAFGLLCVGVGFIGIITPGLPGFVFLLIALWAFRHSSERLEQWLLSNRFVGASLRDWEENGTMRLQTKVLALVLIWVGIGYTIYKILNKPPIVIEAWRLEIPKALPIGLLVATMLGLTIYLKSVPLTPKNDKTAL
jgi:uncharacterized membrane protein YbaN (DUF454 family)